MLALQFNGRVVGDETVARINEAMQAFPTEPMFSPQCFRGRMRVHVYQQELDRPIRELFIEVPNAPD